MKNYYKILQVDRSASTELIKKAFNYHIKKNHPDLSSDKGELANERTQELNEAYSVLSNPEKRKHYDIELEEENKLQNSINFDNINRLLKENESLKEQINQKNKLIEDICKEINIDKSYFLNASEDENNDYSTYDNINIYSNKLKYLLKKIIVIFILIIVVFIMISVITKTNAFAIFFNILLKK